MPILLVFLLFSISGSSCPLFYYASPTCTCAYSTVNCNSDSILSCTNKRLSTDGLSSFVQDLLDVPVSLKVTYYPLTATFGFNISLPIDSVLFKDYLLSIQIAFHNKSQPTYFYAYYPDLIYFPQYTFTATTSELNQLCSKIHDSWYCTLKLTLFDICGETELVDYSTTTRLNESTNIIGFENVSKATNFMCWNVKPCQISSDNLQLSQCTASDCLNSSSVVMYDINAVLYSKVTTTKRLKSLYRCILVTFSEHYEPLRKMTCGSRFEIISITDEEVYFQIKLALLKNDIEKEGMIFGRVRIYFIFEYDSNSMMLTEELSISVVLSEESIDQVVNKKIVIREPGRQLVTFAVFLACLFGIVLVAVFICYGRNRKKKVLGEGNIF